MPDFEIPQPVEPPRFEVAQPVEQEAIEEVEEVPEEVVEQEPEEEDELSDLFATPQPGDNDIKTDHLFNMGGEDDMSDLTEVTDEDVMGEAPEPPRRVIRRVRRTNKPYYGTPPSSMGGMRY